MTTCYQPIEFEGAVPDVATICAACSALAGVSLQYNDDEIYLPEISSEKISFKYDTNAISLCGNLSEAPFLMSLVMNYLWQRCGDAKADLAALKLPTTLQDIKAMHNEMSQQGSGEFAVLFIKGLLYASVPFLILTGYLIYKYLLA